MLVVALSASLSLLVGCSDPTGGGELTITKHKNGRTASRGYVIEDAVDDKHIKVGDWVYFFGNGNKEKEGRYFEDQMHGNWTFWHENGQKLSEGEYKNGKPEGLWVNWYENGQKLGESEYKNGKKEGLWTLWYENGQKDFEGEYKNGLEEGRWTYWNKNGSVSTLLGGIYKAGKKIAELPEK